MAARRCWIARPRRVGLAGLACAGSTASGYQYVRKRGGGSVFVRPHPPPFSCQGSELRTHSDGALAGCSYKALHCRSCQRLVGQRYVATPVELDALREGYSFLTESVVEYRLGSFAVTAVGREGGEEMLSAPPLLSGGGKEQPAQEGLCGRVEELQAEITRVRLPNEAAVCLPSHLGRNNGRAAAHC